MLLSRVTGLPPSFTPQLTGKLPAPLDRGITREEYDGALSWMELCGLTGYWQDFSSATTEYLPDFSDPGLLCR